VFLSARGGLLSLQTNPVLDLCRVFCKSIDEFVSRFVTGRTEEGDDWWSGFLRGSVDESLNLNTQYSK